MFHAQRYIDNRKYISQSDLLNAKFILSELKEKKNKKKEKKKKIL